VSLEYKWIDNQLHILKSGVIRTARILSKGEVYIPF
jgi:4-oxalomesaconate tautomerase